MLQKLKEEHILQGDYNLDVFVFFFRLSSQVNIKIKITCCALDLNATKKHFNIKAKKLSF